MTLGLYKSLKDTLDHELVVEANLNEGSRA
jgi:hypothetical protein